MYAITADGLITLRSKFDADETMCRFEAEVHARGMTVFAHVDHAAGAAAVGLPLRPTDLLIFGAAKGGTHGGTLVGLEAIALALAAASRDGAAATLERLNTLRTAVSGQGTTSADLYQQPYRITGLDPDCVTTQTRVCTTKK